MDNDGNQLAMEKKQRMKDEELFPMLNELMEKYPRDPTSHARFKISYEPENQIHLRMEYKPAPSEKWELVYEMKKLSDNYWRWD